jgi:hypothetical protein
MKILRRAPDHVVFFLRPLEAGVLRALLERYPCVPPAAHRLSRGATGASAAENQRLLAEAMAAQREENRRELAAFLADPARLRPTKRGWRLKLSRGDADWLLRVVNDIRVGSWIRLSSPDFEAGVRVRPNAQTAPHLWAMEVASQFEWPLLQAFDPA